MKEYIVHPPKDNRLAVEEYSTFYGEPVKELIKCKDCRFRDKDGECTKFDAYTSAAGDAFTPPDWFYCGYGKRKEE